MNKASILVVDDSQTIQTILSMMLRKSGFSVLTAEDGVAGLDVLASNTVDLVVTDLNMPRMDGLTFVEKIRANPDIHNMPIIMLSTERDQADVDKALAKGASLYLVKPVQPTVLTNAISELLR